MLCECVYNDVAYISCVDASSKSLAPNTCFRKRELFAKIDSVKAYKGIQLFVR